MVNEYTPGPWSVENWKPGEFSGADICYGRDGNFVALVAGQNYGQWRDADDSGDAEFLANACLIAAAPDLLAALESLVAGNYGQPRGVTVPALDAARAAISKATGQ